MPFDRRNRDAGKRRGQQSSWLQKQIRKDELRKAGVTSERGRQRQRLTREAEPHEDLQIPPNDPVEHVTDDTEAHHDTGPENNQDMPDYNDNIYYGGFDAPYDDVFDTRPSPEKEYRPYNRCSREEENWTGARPQMLDDSRIEHLSDRLRLRKCMEDERASFVETITTKSRRCPVCCAGKSLLSEQGTRMITIVTLEFCHEIEIPLMHCNRQFAPDGEFKFHVNPLQMHVFPAVPVKSFNLFSISTTDKIVLYDKRLLNHLKFQTKFSPRNGINSYASAMIEIIKGNGCKIDISTKLMAKHLNTALHEFTIIDLQLNDPSFDTCPSSRAPIECPACMGSQEYLRSIFIQKAEAAGVSMDAMGPVLNGQKPLLHSVYVDGHYGLPHMRKAGKSRDYFPPFSIKLVSDKVVEEFEKSSTNGDPGRDKPSACCSDFQADSGMKRRSQYYDRTGVVGAFCRHGFCLNILNMTRGEKWCYATLLLLLIMQQIGLPINLWYDINCRYKGHLHRWAASKEEEIGLMMVSWITEVMGFPLPPMHYQMHDLPCQMKNSYMNIRFAGLGAGEPTEIAWSHFRKAGHILQYQALPNRAVGIERLVYNWNHSKRRQSVIFLWDAYQRAVVKWKQADVALRPLIRELSDAGVTKEQMIQYTSRSQAELEARVPEKSYQVQYVEAKMRLQYFDMCMANLKDNPMLEVVLGEDGTHSKTIDRRINIEKARMNLALRNLPEGFPDDAHLIMRAEMDMMAWKLRSDQKSISELFREKEMLRLIEEQHHTRRMECERMRKRRKTIQGRMHECITTFIKLCRILVLKYYHCVAKLKTRGGSAKVPQKEVLEYINSYLPPEIGNAYSEALSVVKLVGPIKDGAPANQQKFHDALKEGCYPWVDKSRRKLESLGVELQRQTLLLRRADEEKKLLIEEMKGCEILFESEMESIAAELNETMQKISVLQEAYENMEHRIINEDNAEDAYLIGCQMKSTETEIGICRFHSDALKRQRDETEPLAKSASICVDVFDRGLNVDASLVQNATDDDEILEDDAANEEGEQDEDIEEEGWQGEDQ